VSETTDNSRLAWREEKYTITNTCKRCGYTWKGWKKSPSTCPSCHSARWSKPRTNKRITTANSEKARGSPVIAIPIECANAIRAIHENTGESIGSIAKKYLIKGGLFQAAQTA